MVLMQYKKIMNEWIMYINMSMSMVQILDIVKI